MCQHGLDVTVDWLDPLAELRTLGMRPGSTTTAPWALAQGVLFETMAGARWPRGEAPV
jgi:hypothetical protein